MRIVVDEARSIHTAGLPHHGLDYSLYCAMGVLICHFSTPYTCEDRKEFLATRFWHHSHYFELSKYNLRDP